MQPQLQLFFVTLEPQSNSFEYQTNEFVAPPKDPWEVIEHLTKETYPDLQSRSIADGTTWYFRDPKQLVLTFMIYSDYFDFADATKLKLVPPKNSPWLALHPEAFDDMSLVSHGLRHLSYHIIQQRPPKWMLASTIEKLAKLEKELTTEVLKADKELSPAKA